MTVFGSDLLVGVPEVFDSYVSLNAESDFGSCGAHPEVGETAVVPGATIVVGADETHVWYRLALLQIDGESASFRIERIVDAERPSSTPYTC